MDFDNFDKYEGEGGTTNSVKDQLKNISKHINLLE